MSLMTNLRSHWRLDEASGTASDAHGINPLSAVNGPVGASGKIGNAREFEAGSLQYLQRGNSLALLLGTDFSGSAWVNLESKAGNGAIAGKWNTGAFEWIVYYNAGNDRFEMAATGNGSSAAVVTASSFGSPATGVWYHVAWGHSSGGTIIWIQINAGTRDFTFFGGTVYQGSADFRIGSDARNLSYFDGMIDEVSIWQTRVLTEAEVAWLYNGGSGKSYPFPTAVCRIVGEGLFVGDGGAA